MNTRILVIALATVLGACVISATALAQQTSDNESASQSTTVTPAAKTKTAKQHAVPSVDSSMCIRYTGSHIPPPKGQCLPVPGRSYSQQDIQRTGATSLGQALRMLGPSVQVGGGH